MDMIKMDDRELLAVRMEIAVGIITKFPDLYCKIFGKSKEPIGDYESGVAEILAIICDMEPTIRHVLDTYYDVWER